MILVTADLHLNDNPRDAYRHNFMSGILPSLIKKHNVELLLILGDITDDKDAHKSWLVNHIVDHFVELAKLCPIIVTKGNHDYTDADNPFFEFLGEIDNVSWITKPKKLILDTKAGTKALFLPHTSFYKKDWADLSFKDCDYIFAHQTFQGAAVGPRKMDGIPLDTFPKDACVISGDIHQPQTFGQITYVGSPYLVDFGDNFKPRVLLLDKGKTQSIPCPGPQKRLVEIISLTDLKKYKGLNPDDILKVRYHLDAADHAQWPEIKAQISKWGEDNEYVIYLIQPVIDRGSGASTQKRKVVSRTDEELLATYSKSRAVNETTLKTGMNLMRKI